MNCAYTNLANKNSFPLLFLLIFLTFTLSAQLPNGFIDAKVQAGYTSPMGIVFSKNGQKMFVWEKKGKLWCSTWNGTTYIKQATAVIDISEEVADWRDFGLQSIALDPNFDSNGLIYTFYQVDRHHLMNFGTPQYSATTDEYFNASISRLTRYKVNTINGVAIADMTSRKVLLGETRSTGVPLLYESHAGGHIVFGTDGTLLVTTGDNASYSSNDLGSASETYWQQAITDGIMRSTENVGAFRAQQINSFCGKLLRLDPNTGDALPSNPYYDAANPRSAKSRTYALGFRNPYRMCLKTGTGSLNAGDGNPGTFIVGDVQNGTWEEFHVVERGGINCGWPLYEGITPQYQFYDSGKTDPEEVGNPTFASQCIRSSALNLTPPVAALRRFYHSAPALDWQHGQNITRYADFNQGGTEAALNIGSAGAQVSGVQFGGSCVTAGTYYTGTTFPPNYRNVFFFADYDDNWIRAASLHDNSNHQIHEVLEFAPAGYTKGIVDIEYCPRDESIFYVNINTGDIQRISYGLGGNRPPVAVISADKINGPSPLTVNFSSIGSLDPDNDAISYLWNFGDGTSSTLANPSHIFTAPVTTGFTVTLTLTDSRGLTDIKTLVISANNTPPSVKITNPTNTYKYTLSGLTQLPLSADVTDNDATGMQYAWQVTLRHNDHEHPEPVNFQTNPTVQISPLGCDGNRYYYFICLTVTDKGGLTAKDSVKIYPDCPLGGAPVAVISANTTSGVVPLTVNFSSVGSYDPNGGRLTYSWDFGNGNTDTSRFPAQTYWTNGATYIVKLTVKNAQGLTAFKTLAIATANLPPVVVMSADTTSGTAPLTVRFSSAGTYNPGGGRLTYSWDFGNGNTDTSRFPAQTYFTNGATYNVTLTVRNPQGLTTVKTLTISTQNTGGTAPVVVMSATPTSGAAPLTVRFSSAGTYNPNGGALTYLWDFGNGNTDTSRFPAQTYWSNGATYNVTLTVKNAQGLTTVKTLTISTQNTGGALPVVVMSATPTSGAAPLTVRFSSAGTYNPNGGVLTYLWNFGNGNTDTSPFPAQTYLTNGATYNVTLTVRNAQGLTTIKTLIITTTLAQSLDITNLTPTPQINAMALSWIPPTAAYDEVMVVAKLIGGFTVIPSGTSYIANASFIGNGTVFDGGKVVYRGIGTNMTVTNLTGGSRYFFRVYTRKGTTWTSGIEISAVPNSPRPLTLGCLKGSYFTTVDLSGAAAVVRAESSINYDWGLNAPVAGIGIDNFSVRWEGIVVPSVSGTYTFAVTADDGVRLWVNNVLIINKWIDQPPTTYTAIINLVQGQNVPIKMEYYERAEDAVIKLFWTAPGTSSQAVPFSACPLEFDAALCYKLTARSSSKILNVPNNSTTTGTQLQAISPTTIGRSELWRIKDLGDGSYRLVNTNSGKTATVLNASTLNNTAIVQWDWQINNSQRWIFAKNTEGYYKLTAKHSNKAMEATTAATSLVVQNTPSTITAQQFKIETVTCPVGAVAMESANILTAHAYRDAKKGVITWVSNANDNSDYFMVQKLNANQPVFEKLQTLNAQIGSADDRKFYTVEDNQPYDGENFYRVALFRKGEDTPQYSEVISLDFSFLNDFMLYPNPSNDYVDIDLEAVRYRSVDITITDVSGKVLKQQKVESAPVAPLRISLSEFATGQYFMRVEAEGKREVVKKLTIVR